MDIIYISILKLLSQLKERQAPPADVMTYSTLRSRGANSVYNPTTMAAETSFPPSHHVILPAFSQDDVAAKVSTVLRYSHDEVAANLPK